MKNKKYILLLFLMISLLKVDCQEFRLFDEGEKEGTRYYNYSLEINEYQKVTEQVMTGINDRSVLYRSMTFDTIELKYFLDSKYFIKQKIAYDSMEIELEILPERDSIVKINEKQVNQFLHDRISFDWTINEKTCKDYRASNNWKWTESKLVKDTVIIEKSYGNHSYEKLLKLDAVKKKILIFNPKEKINRDQIEGSYKTLILYKINSIDKQFKTLEGTGIQFTTTERIAHTKRKGGTYLLKETISDKEVKTKLKWIKRRLSESGYYKGKIDNEISLDFMKSLMSYQKVNGLSIGQFDIDTINLLVK